MTVTSCIATAFVLNYHNISLCVSRWVLLLMNMNREARAIEFYNLLSSFDYMSSTPTLFNAGTLRPQLSSCYLTTVPDDLEGIR